MTIRSRHVPPTASFPLPLSAVQLGHSTGNLCSSMRAETCPRRHSRQNVCPQGSRRAIESTGIFSKHMPHSNNRWADSAGSARCAASARSSLSNSCCRRIAYKTLSRLSSRPEGGVNGLPALPSARSGLELADGESGESGRKRLKGGVDVDTRCIRLGEQK